VKRHIKKINKVKMALNSTAGSFPSILSIIVTYDTKTKNIKVVIIKPILKGMQKRNFSIFGNLIAIYNSFYYYLL